MSDWKDTSSYSRSDTDRTPKTWTAKLGSLKLVVTRHIYFEPDDWVMTFQPFCDQRRLESKEIEVAKQESVRIAADYLAEVLKLLAKIQKGETE